MKTASCARHPKIRLLRHAADEDPLQKFTFETTLVGRRVLRPGSHSSRDDDDASPAPKRARRSSLPAPRGGHAGDDPGGYRDDGDDDGDDGNDDDGDDDAGRPASRLRRRARRATDVDGTHDGVRGGGKARRANGHGGGGGGLCGEEVGRPAFRSLEKAVGEGKLFHSVLQVPLRLGCVEDGQDSDEEVSEEQEWRMRVAREEMMDYVDTNAVERLFMNLWNQFVNVDRKITSDREMGDACLQFVRRYHKVLKKMRLEFTLTRHLGELARIGLVDSNCMFRCVMSLRELEKTHGDEDEPQFRYGEYAVRYVERCERERRGRTSRREQQG